MSELVQIPLWLLVGLIGMREFVTFRNGKKGNTCARAVQLLEDDPPRRHTEQLSLILAELKHICRELKVLNKTEKM